MGGGFLWPCQHVANMGARTAASVLFVLLKQIVQHFPSFGDSGNHFVQLSVEFLAERLLLVLAHCELRQIPVHLRTVTVDLREAFVYERKHWRYLDSDLLL